MSGGGAGGGAGRRTAGSGAPPPLTSVRLMASDASFIRYASLVVASREGDAELVREWIERHVEHHVDGPPGYVGTTALATALDTQPAAAQLSA